MAVKEVNEYDDVELKDGEVGTVIEKYSDIHFMLDVSPTAYDNKFRDMVHIDDIVKVIRKNK